MILVLSLVVLACAVAVVYYGRTFFARELERAHVKRVEALHMSYAGKHKAILNVAKQRLEETARQQWEIDKLLIDVRQTVEKNADLENRTQKLVQDTEILMNDPRVQRAIKSG